MKKKYKILLFSLLAFLLVFKWNEILVIAEDGVESFTVGYADGKKYLDKITSKVWFGNDVFGLSSETLYLINNFVQAVFWVSKMIFYVCSGIYEFLSSFGAFEDEIRFVLQVSSKIFRSIFNLGFNYLAIGLAVFTAYLAYALRGANFFKELFRNLVPILCVVVLFVPIGDRFVIMDIYESINKEVETFSVNVKTSFTTNGIVEDAGISDGTSESSVLDEYFKSSIWLPYKYMNSEFSNGSDLVGSDASFVMNGLFERLVFYESGDDDFRFIEGNDDTKIEKIAGTVKEPENEMLKNAWGKKFMFATASIVDTLLYGVLLDALGLTAVVLKIMILLMIILGAFTGILALFPSMENVIIVWLKRFGTILLLSGLMNVFTLVLFWLYSLLSKLLMTTFNNNMILASVAKVFIIWILWEKRNWFIDILTSGRMRSLDNGFTLKISSMGRKPVRSLGGLKDNAMSRLGYASRASGRRFGRTVASGVTFGGSFIHGKLRPVTKDDDSQSSSRLSLLSGAKNKVLEMSARKDELSTKLSNIKAQAYDGYLGDSQPGQMKKKQHLKDRDDKLAQSTIKKKRVSYNRLINHLKPGVSQEQRILNNEAKSRIRSIREERQKRLEPQSLIKTKRNVRPVERSISRPDLSVKSDQPLVKPVNRPLSRLKSSSGEALNVSFRVKKSVTESVKRSTLRAEPVIRLRRRK